MCPTKSLIKTSPAVFDNYQQFIYQSLYRTKHKTFLQLFYNFNMSHTANPDSFDNGKNQDFIHPKVQRSAPMRKDGVSVP